MKREKKAVFQIEIVFSTSILDYKGVQARVFDALIDYANHAGLKPDNEDGFTSLITVNCLSTAIPAIQADPFPIEEVPASTSSKKFCKVARFE